MKRPLQLKDLTDYNFDLIPDGANYIFDDQTPVAVLMNYQYYKYLEHLMEKAKEAIQKDK